MLVIIWPSLEWTVLRSRAVRPSVPLSVTFRSTSGERKKIRRTFLETRGTDRKTAAMLTECFNSVTVGFFFPTHLCGRTRSWVVKARSYLYAQYLTILCSSTGRVVYCSGHSAADLAVLQHDRSASWCLRSTQHNIASNLLFCWQDSTATDASTIPPFIKVLLVGLCNFFDENTSSENILIVKH